MIEQSRDEVRIPDQIQKYDWVTIVKTKKIGCVTDVRTHSDGTKEFFVKYFRGAKWFTEPQVTLQQKH